MAMTNPSLSSRLLAFLLEDTIIAALVHRSGVLVRIPRPERLAIYRLLTAQHNAAAGRLDRAAAELDQAAALLAILMKDRPDDVRTAWAIAIKHFANEFKSSLSQAHHIRDRLTTQD